MIFADMKGNVGNQMFIYACARQLQEITGQKIVISTYYLKRNYPSYQFNLDLFPLNENVVIEDKKIPFYASSESKFFKIFRRLTFRKELFQKWYFKFFSLFNVFVWNGTSYEKIKLRKHPKNIYLSGYWQSPEYFQNIRDILLSEFRVDSARFQDSDFYNSILKHDSICLSIRRGDYVSDPKIRAIHLVCDDSYYKQGVEIIAKSVADPLVVCFSDDPEWVRANLQIGFPAIFEAPGNALIDKIFLMKACKHFVLSNSSFSWWVEFLSENPNKKVVAPNCWYADKRRADIYQDYWTVLRTEAEKKETQ